MTTLIAVDPGLRGCGVAAGIDKQVTAAAYVISGADPTDRRAYLWGEMAVAVRAWALYNGMAGRDECQLVIELPQVYKASHQRGQKIGTNPQDLIELAAVVGGITERLNLKTTVYLPAEWKGQVPKSIVHDRARARLSPTELVVVQKGLPRASLAHNVWDAVSLYLRHVGRL